MTNTHNGLFTVLDKREQWLEQFLGIMDHVWLILQNEGQLLPIPLYKMGGNTIHDMFHIIVMHKYLPSTKNYLLGKYILNHRSNTLYSKW